MQYTLSRRNLIISIPLLVGASACAETGSSGYECKNKSNALDTSFCRQQKFSERDIEYVTVGVVVGAAIGIGATLALGGNPAVGILIGAVAGGSLTLAERYIEYKLKESKGDFNKFSETVGQDASIDNSIMKHTINDVKIITQAAIAAAQEKDTLSGLANLAKARDARKFARKNVEHASITSSTYEKVAEICKLEGNQIIMGSIQALLANKDTLKSTLSEYDRKILAEGIII